MHRLLSAALLLAVAVDCAAGYDEFTILDFGTCKAYTLTSNWGSAEFRTEADQRQHQQDRANAAIATDANVYALRNDESTNKTPYFAACDYTSRSIVCHRIGRFPYERLACPVGGSMFHPWVRTCTATPITPSAVKIYWVDTSEHEDGSNRKDNPYLEADLRQFRSRCAVR